MDANRTKGTTHHLEIYVGDGCNTCLTAYELADEVERWEVRNLTIDIVHLGEAGAIRPGAVFAVPTYLLDGVVISLGNPSADELRAHLQRIIGVA